MPDDERKGRRLGDETKGRIADLASGWTVDGDSPPAPEPFKRDASGPNRLGRDASGPNRIPREPTGASSIVREAPRRKAKTVPPPPPGSPARKALEDKIIELREVYDAGDASAPDDPADPADPDDFADLGAGSGVAAPDADDDAGEDDAGDDDLNELDGLIGAGDIGSPARRAALTGGGLAAASRMPAAAPVAPQPAPGPASRSPRARHDGGDPLDLTAVPESDKTKENRGAVGMKSGSHSGLTTNAASGTIGGDDTPAPLFDRAAIAAGQQGALASERVARPTRTGQVAASTRGPADKPAAELSRPNASAAAASADNRPLPSASPRPPGPSWPTPMPLPSASPPAAEPSWPTPRGGMPSQAAPIVDPRPAPDAAPVAARRVGAPSQAQPIVDKRSVAAPIVDRRSAPVTTPPPASRPPAAAPAVLGKRPSAPGWPAPGARADSEGVDVSDAGELRDLHDDSGISAAVAALDDSGVIVAPPGNDSPRAPAPIVRDHASTLLGVAEPAPRPAPPPAPRPAAATAPPPRPAAPPPRPAVATPPPPSARAGLVLDQVRGDPTFDDASGASPDRGDPTLGEALGESSSERGDATSVSTGEPRPAPARAQTRATVGTLRSSAALPRKRGLVGDMRYVATVVFGVRAANRELAELDTKQATRQQSRKHHLVTLGRTAVALPEWQRGGGSDHAALDPARTQLATVEDERTEHANQVAAADTELAQVRRDRDARAVQHKADLIELDAELVQVAKKLEPLEKEAIAVRKRAVDLHDSLRHIDAKIATTTANLTSLKGGKLDRGEVQAELASLKADRKAIQSDEPVIAGELDALAPRIAALEAARSEAQIKRGELERIETDDQRRVADLLAAIGAKRKVVDRAASDAEALRDKILFQLGERLYVDRPDDLASQLAPIDEIDVDLGIADRRMMELREITSSVDRWKVARGVALLVVIVGGLGALTWWLLLMFG